MNRKSLCSARWPNGNWLDDSIWDKTKSMSWPEKDKSSFGHVYNHELKALDFSPCCHIFVGFIPKIVLDTVSLSEAADKVEKHLDVR